MQETVTDYHALYATTLGELTEALVERDHLRAQVAEMQNTRCVLGPKCPNWQPRGWFRRLLG